MKSKIMSIICIAAAVAFFGLIMLVVPRHGTQRHVCRGEIDLAETLATGYASAIYETSDRYAWQRHLRMVDELQIMCEAGCSPEVRAIVARMASLKRAPDGEEVNP